MLWTKNIEKLEFLSGIKYEKILMGAKRSFEIV